MAEPIAVRVLRYRCPHCVKSYSRPIRARQHMSRCWLNPDARGCKTCQHFVSPWQADGEEYCESGVSLAGRPQCKTCGGFGDVPGADLGMTECPDCAGDGAEIKPGPIVHCNEWRAAEEGAA